MDFKTAWQVGDGANKPVPVLGLPVLGWSGEGTRIHQSPQLRFTNGTYPRASLLMSGDTLYGTTQNYGGGTGGGYGSVFKMGIDWFEKLSSQFRKQKSVAPK